MTAAGEERRCSTPSAEPPVDGARSRGRRNGRSPSPNRATWTRRRSSSFAATSSARGSSGGATSRRRGRPARRPKGVRGREDRGPDMLLHEIRFAVAQDRSPIRPPEKRPSPAARRVPAFLFGVSPPGRSSAITGRDGESFLRGLCTNDVRGLGADAAVWAAALTPTGESAIQFRASRRDSQDPPPPRRRSGRRRGDASPKILGLPGGEDRGPSPRPLRFDFYDAVPTLPTPSTAGRDSSRSSKPGSSRRKRPQRSRANSPRRGALISEEGVRAPADRSGPAARRGRCGRIRTPDEAGLGGAVSTTKAALRRPGEVVARMRRTGDFRADSWLFTFPAALFLRRLAPHHARQRAEEAGEGGRRPCHRASDRSGSGYAARDVPDGDVLAFADDRRVCPRRASRRTVKRRPDGRSRPRGGSGPGDARP